MKNSNATSILIAILIVGLTGSIAQSRPNFGDEWISLFNGKDLEGWRVSEAAAQSWRVIDGVINCDPRSQLSGDLDIWTEESYDDFKLYVEWRLTDAPTFESRPLIGQDGNVLIDDQGNEIRMSFFNADSGIYLRGMTKAQVNIWNWPIGSGEVWGYRTDNDMPAEVRAGATPKVRADHPIGEWNTFIIRMKGDRLTVLLNGHLVIEHARLPGVAESGPLGLQYHGGYDFENQRYRNASSLVEFRNIYLKKLD